MRDKIDQEAARAVRARLLHDRVPDHVLACALGIGPRMVYYYCERGLPYIRLSGRRYFNVSEAIDWLKQRRHKVAEPAPLPPPRPVGRPRTIPVPGAQARPERLPATDRAKAAVQPPNPPSNVLAAPLIARRALPTS